MCRLAAGACGRSNGLANAQRGHKRARSNAPVLTDALAVQHESLKKVDAEQRAIIERLGNNEA
jgi:hypothetical protein